MLRTNGPIQLYPLLRVAICLAAGIVVGYETYGLVGWGAWLAALAVAVALTVTFHRHDLWQGAMIGVSSLLLGATLVTARCDVLFRPLPQGEVAYEAVVASQPMRRGKVLRMDLWLVGEQVGRRVKAALLVDTLSPLPALGVGDGLVATSVLEAPANYYRSHFDYPLYLRCHGFTATTLILPGQWRSAPVGLSSLSHLDRSILAALKFRQAALHQYLALGLDDDEMAVAVAMALGDRSRITNDLRDIYSISGASHVLALSGLHLGIIYMLLSMLVGWRRLGALREVVVIGGIWSYALFTGLSPSVVRAAVMITVFALTSLLHRRRMSLNALALTAIVMLVAEPMHLYDVGFQMSFLAVLAILLFYRPLYRLVSAEWLQAHPLLKWGWAMVVVSCCAQLGVAPLTAYYFGRFSVYFLLTNCFVIPLAYAVLYLTAALFMTTLLPPLLPWVARLLAAVVGCQTTMARWVASLPGSHIEGISINRLQLVLLYVAIAALAVAAGRFMRGRGRND